MPPPPEGPRPQPWIFPPRHPTPITGVAGARQDLSDIAPLTVVWQQCLLENIAARGIQDRAVPLGPALRLSVSDRLCGLSARCCTAPCPGQPSRGRLAPHLSVGDSRKATRRGSAAAPAPSLAEFERKEWLPGQKRAFYCQKLARCEPASVLEMLGWCASVLGGKKRSGCLWGHRASVRCLAPV